MGCSVSKPAEVKNERIFYTPIPFKVLDQLPRGLQEMAVAFMSQGVTSSEYVKVFISEDDDSYNISPAFLLFLDAENRMAHVVYYPANGGELGLQKLWPLVKLSYYKSPFDASLWDPRAKAILSRNKSGSELLDVVDMSRITQWQTNAQQEPQSALIA